MWMLASLLHVPRALRGLIRSRPQTACLMHAHTGPPTSLVESECLKSKRPSRMGMQSPLPRCTDMAVVSRSEEDGGGMAPRWSQSHSTQDDGRRLTLAWCWAVWICRGQAGGCPATKAAGSKLPLPSLVAGLRAPLLSTPTAAEPFDRLPLHSPLPILQYSQSHHQIIHNPPPSESR